MANLYPSWIEIPVADVARAARFYQAIFALDDMPRYNEPPAQIVVLTSSDKAQRAPGVSLVQSPDHHPGGGVVINFHLGDHAALDGAVAQVRQHGGQVPHPAVDTNDGQRYLTVLDSEGNRIALSSYEPVGD
ncbi:MAG: hypothetical protein HC828_06340 [Blastochloris sp.]|nr:hypothetical protein [Blastochloris sp.]